MTQGAPEWRLNAVEGGGCERFAAQAGTSGGGGGEALPRTFINSSARPATSDEVRRIYRLPPLPPTSGIRLIENSMFAILLDLTFIDFD